jgi:hypothetical protein
MDIKKGFGMAKSFAQSLASRGFSNKKTEPFTKKLRVLSCYGNQHTGGPLPPCEHLKQSKTEGRYYCGGCGCGDRRGTWLMANDEEYSKLDYPNLSCPLNMPGFSNYEVSNPEESIQPITRRYFIENMDEDEIESTVTVTNPEIPEETKKALEDRKEKLDKKN